MLDAERETTMTWDSKEKVVHIYTARPRDQGVLRRAGVEPAKGSKEQGFFYFLPLDRFRWGVRKLDHKKRPAPTHLFSGTSRAKKAIMGVGLWLCLALASPAWACDSLFLQEPTTREPDTILLDTVAGFLFTTWSFPDGRALVTVRQILDVSVEQEVRTKPYPLFYLVTTKDHVTLTYIDREGEGHCDDIERY